MIKMNIPLSVALPLVVPIVLSVLKNPQNRKKVRRVCLEIFRAIKSAYADDDEFK